MRRPYADALRNGRDRQPMASPVFNAIAGAPEQDEKRRAAQGAYQSRDKHQPVVVLIDHALNHVEHSAVLPL
ncbi:hypothetical protein [Sphingobium fontiphilum]|uniref:hypothetical protein n=1 Tax=Sphingobium fontiphilum TaxID=944425 RepID=UPI001FE7A94A|nr:hypothetical protein [Sphingobium fontiphilum]